MELIKRLCVFIIFLFIIFLSKWFITSFLLIFDITFDNWIDITSLFVNIFIAYYITVTLQNKINNTKANKDFIINEISNFKSNYDFFIENLYNGDLTNEHVLKKFKDFTMFLEIVKENFKDYSNQIDNLLKEHIKIRDLVTISDNFNDNYNTGDNFKLTDPHLKSDLRKLNKSIISNIYHLIVNINNN